MAEYTFVAAKFIGFILLLAAASKLYRPQKFRRSIGQLVFVPRGAAAPLSLIVPISEAIVGLMLICSIWVDAAALVAAVMMLCFAVILAGNVSRGHRVVSCGCFGGSVRHLGWSDVCSNVLLAAIACSVVLLSHRGGGEVTDSEFLPAADALSWIALSSLGVYAAFVYRSAGELRELLTVGRYRLGRSDDAV